MRKSDYRGARVTKVKLQKSDSIIKLYDKIQIAYAEVLENNDDVEKIICNYLLDGLEEGQFTSDFVCIKKDGDYMVRECVFRSKLSLPRTCKLLDASRNYWRRRGVTDWGIVVEKKQDKEGEADGKE